MALNPATEVQGSGEIIDHDGRLIVVLSGNGGGTPSTDVSDRIARLLGHVNVDNLPVTQPISAVALPLPAGAAMDATVANRFAGLKTPVATSVSTNGDNTIHAPASGKKMTLFWLGMSSSQNNSAEVLVTVKLGTKVCYEWYMGNPGAFSHWEPIVADNTDDALIVNLSAGGSPVLVNATFTEA